MKTNWVVITCGVISLISLNLFIVSFLSPGWLVYSNFRNRDLELHMGLFYYNWCIDDRSSCKSEFYNNKLDTIISKDYIPLTHVTVPNSQIPGFGPDGDIYTEYLVEMIIAIVFMMFACCFVFMYLRVTPPVFLSVPMILLAVPGILVWIATGRFLRNDYYTFDVMGIPYCLILNGIGATLCFIVIIILVILMIYDWYRYNGSDRSGLVKRETVSVANPQYVTSQQPQLVYY